MDVIHTRPSGPMPTTDDDEWRQGLDEGDALLATALAAGRCGPGRPRLSPAAQAAAARSANRNAARCFDATSRLLSARTVTWLPALTLGYLRLRDDS